MIEPFTRVAYPMFWIAAAVLAVAAALSFSRALRGPMRALLASVAVGWTCYCALLVGDPTPPIYRLETAFIAGASRLGWMVPSVQRAQADLAGLIVLVLWLSWLLVRAVALPLRATLPLGTKDGAGDGVASLWSALAAWAAGQGVVLPPAPRGGSPRHAAATLVYPRIDRAGWTVAASWVGAAVATGLVIAAAEAGMVALYAHTQRLPFSVFYHTMPAFPYVSLVDYLIPPTLKYSMGSIVFLFPAIGFLWQCTGLGDEERMRLRVRVYPRRRRAALSLSSRSTTARRALKLLTLSLSNSSPEGEDRGDRFAPDTSERPGSLPSAIRLIPPAVGWAPAPPNAAYFLERDKIKQAEAFDEFAVATRTFPAVLAQWDRGLAEIVAAHNDLGRTHHNLELSMAKASGTEEKLIAALRKRGLAVESGLAVPTPRSNGDLDDEYENYWPDGAIRDPSHNLLVDIEVDGPTHAERPQSDRRRDEWLASRGWYIVRVNVQEAEQAMRWNHRWHELVARDIEGLCAAHRAAYAHAHDHAKRAPGTVISLEERRQGRARPRAHV